MSNVYRLAPAASVPGASSDAISEQLRLIREQSNANLDAAPPPASALEQADRIRTEWIDAPLRRTLGATSALAPAPLRGLVSAGGSLAGGAPAADEQQPEPRDPSWLGQALRVGVSAVGPAGFLGVAEGLGLSGLGQLSPEESQEDADQRLLEARRADAAAKDRVSRREQLRGLTGEQAAQLGFPTGPMDEDTLREMQAAESSADATRVEAAAAELGEAVERVVDPELQAKQAWWLNTMRSVYKGASGVATSSVAYPLAFLETAFGSENAAAAREWVGAADALIEKMMPADKARAKDFMNELGNAGGSMLGFMTLGFLGSALGFPRSAATAYFGAAATGMEQFEDAERFNATATTKLYALLLGGALGVSEAVPINRMLLRAEQATGGLVSRLLTNTASSTMEEFLQEFGQAAGHDLVAKWLYDEQRELDASSWVRQGVIGGIVGGMAGAATSTLHEAGVVHRQDTSLEGRLPPEAQEQLVGAAMDDAQAQLDAIFSGAEPVAPGATPTTAPDVALEVVPETAQAVEQQGQDLQAMRVQPGEAAVAEPQAAEAVAPEQAEAVTPEQAAETATEPAEVTLDSIVEEVNAVEGPRRATDIAEDVASRLPRAEDIYGFETVKGRGGTVPAPNELGNIVLRHWSSQVLDVVDPAMRGTGPTRGDERARLSGPDAVDRAYYGVRAGDELRPPSVGVREFSQLSAEEKAAIRRVRGVTQAQVRSALEDRYWRLTRGGGYRREAGLGPYRHEVDVRPDDLYNAVEDPLGLRAQLEGMTVPGERANRYERLIKEAGFKGVYYPTSQLGQTAILFEAARPRVVGDEVTGEVTEVPATLQDFEAPTADAFARPGWAIVTATQEAVGPWDAPANVEANERLRAQLEAEGIEFVEVSGAYQGVDQGVSFLIIAPEQRAEELGAEFGQESILTNRGLVYTDGSERVVPALHGETVVGPEAEQADFYSTLPDGTAFTMGLDFSTPPVELSPAELEPLPGLTTGRPVESVVRAAREYAISRGLPIRRQAEYVRADPERGRRIAEAYEQMEHAPDDPAVAASYQAMIEETLAQYQFVKQTGLVVEAIEPGMADPYPEGPKQVLDDLERGHLWFFPTDQGFGTLTEAEASNPLLAPTDEYIGERRLLANDVFRIVHDFFGHGIEGSGFGARGEENAWQSHMRLYSEAALPAVTSETRGQNSWVNFGPHGEANRSNQRETVYADQKTGLMPEWTWREGVAEEFDFEAARLAGEVAGSDEGARADVLAQTSRGRGQLPAEQRRDGRGVRGETSAEQDNLSLARISQNLIRALDLAARQGRFTIRGADVLGQYDRRQDTVRIRSWNDLSTLVHEAGHAVEARAGAELKAFVKANDALLKDVAKQLYGGYSENLPEPTKTAEGFAEFFRVYTLNRKFAEKKYATLTQGFDAVLDQTSPELRKSLDLIGQQFAAWLQLPSAQVVRNTIVSGLEPSGFNQTLAEISEDGFPTWFREVYTKTLETTVNRFAQVDRLVADILNVGESNRGQVIDLKRAENPATLIRLASNVGARAMVQAADGVMGHKSVKPTTRGLRDAILRYHGLNPDQKLKAIDPNRQRDFAAYLVSLRGIDEYRRFAEGKIDRPPLGQSLADLRVTVREMNARYGPNFAEAAQIVHEYGMGLWQKSYEAGLISSQTYKDGLDRQFYVPLQRDMSDKALTMSEMGSQVRQGGSIVKRFRGSDRDVIDPMDVLMHKTFSLERVIAENEVKLALARLADRAGGAGALVERVPAHKLIGTEYDIKEVARQLTRDPSVSEADAADLMVALEASIEEGNRIALFRSQQAVAAGENILFFWEKGKLAAIQIKDGEIGADIVNTMNGVGRETVPLFLDTVATVSTAFRTAITSWPDFLLVNFIRDQMSAWVLTDVGYKPFVTGLRGVGDELRQKQWAREYNAAMGMMGGMNVAALHEARVNRDISTLRSKGYLARAFQDGGMRGAIQGLARVVELTETGTRLGVYRKAVERGKAEGLTDWEAAVEGAYIATDIANFGLNGSRMLAWRRAVPFLNAQLQGLYKMMRTLGGDEARQRKGLNFALRSFFKNVNGLELSRVEKQALNTGRKAWVKMASLGFIGALLHFLFEDDPDYQDASEYMRSTGWVIPTGDGRIFYIPKPFELAVVSNIVERAFESASGDGEAKNRLLRGFGMTLMPPASPPALSVVVEQMANYSFFAEREIVPDYMRALAPELQYNHLTSTFAKQVGEIMGWSPMRVDHALSGLGASAYRDAMFMYNSTDPNRPQPDATDMPITRRFVRDARRGSTSSRDFWTFASTVDGSLRRAELSYRRYIDEGREDAAQEYLTELDEEERAYAVLNTHFKADAKKLNPIYRVRQLSTIVSGMRREMLSPLGVEMTATGIDDPLQLTAREKAEIDETLSEYIRREVRNTLIYQGAPGWANKAPLPTQPTLDLLLTQQPLVLEELERRIRKAKVYDEETVRDYWPDVRDRLITDGPDAFLGDVLAVAKAMRR